MDASSHYKNSLTTPDRLMATLSLDISYTTHTHPPLRTVEDAKAFHDLQGAIKTYICATAKRNFLLVVEEDKSIDLKAPRPCWLRQVVVGSAERLFEMLGVRPGAVALSR